MGLFDRLRDPIVLKESSSAYEQLEQLNLLRLNAPNDIKSQIERDITAMEYGIRGEESLLFELRNSHIPMYILRDLFFENNGLTTQIDFLVVTRKLVLIIECKNLYGSITVDEQGSFIREDGFGRREGIYSPITQNQRHLDMIKEIRRQSKNSIQRMFFDMNFDNNYKSVVVLANPKSVLNSAKAPKTVKNTIIRLDRLNSYIKDLLSSSKNESYTDNEMKELAEFFLLQNKVNPTDYCNKYQQKSEINTDVRSFGSALENTPVYNALKEYRYRQSRTEKIKPYFIFNNAQLESIISADPKNLDELKALKGFGDVKCEKYGNDIISILKKYR